ncbi:DUF4307 domain-containing protein [Microbacterium sp. NPDC055910]|uniref:DUF4307 domain-containing protein n=1 Tax=Microbacterium sp. NPDC055910 TaxID=3345659 RepID=UPI0035DA48DA
MTTQDMLDRRYGRRGRGGSRALVIIGIALAVVAVGLFSWMTVASSLDSVDADTTGFDLVDERTVVLDFQFTSPPGRSVACVLEAQDEEHGVVGWKVVEYEASDMHGRAYREVIPTTAPAVSGFVNDCWVT